MGEPVSELQRYRERHFVPPSGRPYRPSGLVLPWDTRFVPWSEVRAFRKLHPEVTTFLSTMMDESLAHWGSYQEGQLVSLQAYSRPTVKGVRYLNSYYVYTIPEARFRGHSEATFRASREAARQAGIERVKTAIQSIGGIRMHLRVGLDYWGVDPHGSIAADSQISPDLRATAHPVPADIRKRVKEPRLLTNADMLEVLTDPFGIFARPYPEVVELLARYPGLRP